MNLDALLQTAIEAANAGSAELVKRFRGELKIQTKTKVLVPCPVLVFDAGLSTSPILEVKTTYTYKIKNPKPFKSEK